MGTAIASVIAWLGIGAESHATSLARTELGAHWNLVVALDIINTAVVVFYLWRIWREKLPPARQRAG